MLIRRLNHARLAWPRQNLNDKFRIMRNECNIVYTVTNPPFKDHMLRVQLVTIIRLLAQLLC